MASKIKASSKPVTPPIIHVGGDDNSDPETPSTKTSEVIHKSIKDATTLCQVLGKIEDTIQELTRLLAESQDSDHQGVGGQNILTPKQQAIMNELKEARARYDAILQLMTTGVN